MRTLCLIDANNKEQCHPLSILDIHDGSNSMETCAKVKMASHILANLKPMPQVLCRNAFYLLIHYVQNKKALLFAIVINDVVATIYVDKPNRREMAMNHCYMEKLIQQRHVLPTNWSIS